MQYISNPPLRSVRSAGSRWLAAGHAGRISDVTSDHCSQKAAALDYVRRYQSTEKGDSNERGILSIFIISCDRVLDVHFLRAGCRPAGAVS